MQFLRRHLIAITLGVLLAGGLTGCGNDDRRYALAITDATDSFGLTLTVECATDLDWASRPDPEGSGLVEITVWGRPKVGRCEPEIRILDLTADKFVDGATSQVVDVTR